MTCLNPNTTERAKSVFIQVFLSAPVPDPAPAPVSAPALAPAPDDVVADIHVVAAAADDDDDVVVCTLLFTILVASLRFSPLSQVGVVGCSNPRRP